jgi:2-oxoglutarate dehydrogenase E2 component (dihydrolipoamide succinyltransferase)
MTTQYRGNETMTEIRVPTLGESVTEATIGRWFKKAGDAVAVDEPLVELETDKVTIEVPAPSAGTLGEIVAKDGETVAVGALLGQINDGAAAAKPAAAPPKADAPAKPAAPAAPAAAPAAAAAAPAQKTPPADAPLAPSSPRSRRRRRRRRRSISPPPRCRYGRRRRPTMPRARSA